MISQEAWHNLKANVKNVGRWRSVTFKTNVRTKCWIAQSKSIRKGYVKISMQVARNKTANGYLHRWMYEQVFGAIPVKKHILHSCNNSLCINPSHLRIGDAKENMKDAMNARHTLRGDKHPFAKLNWEKVRRIRSSNLRTELIAAKFGVSKNTIRCIRRNLMWRPYDR